MPPQSDSKTTALPTLSLLYRGSLSSCNYQCSYCPFAKTYNTKQELQQDAYELQRFVDWVSKYNHKISVLFTPWGEGLVRKHYQLAMCQLSHLPHIQTVAIQTNLCINTKWLEQANLDRLALWATYHPSQVTLERFVERCIQLNEMGVNFSVGMVAIQEDYRHIDNLRRALPAQIPMWLNAYDGRTTGYYAPSDLEWLSSIDPNFFQSVNPSKSLNAPCHTGVSVFSVNATGDVRRCHFVPYHAKYKLGNLYDGSFLDYLSLMNDRATPKQSLACPNTDCDCFIGYVHRPDLSVHHAYKNDRFDGTLSRIPVSTIA